MRTLLLFILAGVLMTTLHARAEPPTLAISNDGALVIDGLADDAPTPIDITGNDVLPITWSRGSLREATLPLVLTPGAADPVVMTLLKQSRSVIVSGANVPHVQIYARAYERVATWRPVSSPGDRRTTLLLAIAFATTVLLAALMRKGGTVVMITLAVAWTIGLTIAASRRPTLLIRDEPDGSRWFLAVEGQLLRVPIRDEIPWLPVVESFEHLRSLSPRVIVDGREGWIELTLPKAAKILLIPSPP